MAWALEFMITVTQNSPFRFKDPGHVLSCFLFIIAANFVPAVTLAIISDRFSRDNNE
jgi:hypothetical protein